MLQRKLLAALVAAIAGCAGRVASAPGGASDAIAGVAAAHPLAVDAGLAVLERGGSAVDAAVAIQAMLGLVEPQSSGLGGGAFLVHYEAATGRVRVWDGREVAPRGASPAQFLGADGLPIPFDSAVIGGTATGVPGAVPMLGVAHSALGHLPWSELFAEAIHAAEQGFVVPRRLGRFANGSSAQMQQPDARALLWNPRAGRLIAPGDTFRNPAYAATLRALATRGPRALHEGPIADSIVARLGRGARPSTMTREDLASYEPVEREALCAPFRAFIICAPPPPSSAVVALGMLRQLEHTDIAARGPDDPRAWFLFAEASRMMYVDRDRYVADPAFVSVPTDALLSEPYVAARAALIGDRAMPTPTAGSVDGIARGDAAGYEESGTTHFVVVDFDGNVVSMTTTVESVFGSGRVVGGFFLNNQLTDFTFAPIQDGRPVANAVAPGKRPRSSMAPMIALDRNRRAVAAFGSPGGASILTYNTKVAVGLLAWGLPLQHVIELPNVVGRDPRLHAELSRMLPWVRDSLRALGLPFIEPQGEDSGLHGLAFRGPGRIEGGADARRDGAWRVTTQRPPRKR